MYTVSRELSERLHELSGWEDQTWWHVYEWDLNTKRTGEQTVETSSAIHYEDAREHVICPAYDSGYLLRNLPQPTVVEMAEDSWVADIYGEGHENGYIDTNNLGLYADNPEDALCKLAIKLFEEGVI